MQERSERDLGPARDHPIEDGPSDHGGRFSITSTMTQTCEGNADSSFMPATKGPRRHKEF
ncbi:hypothetical protein BDZ85DRAFT_258476 [Elsinoe ampelina]|uniref:Uncharacterized protein n=1 Tax=Elsinoe ampelina TaxID=302913 RepID=A0A6A6GK50_9PEZI|nr:hypothetical protein BDZ85DRAFT_258476 [Elsinoe ampelina]